MSTSPYARTPLLSHHARERCKEMEIRTRVAKRIVQHADCVRPGKPGSDAMVATCDEFPEYAVVYEPGDPAVIVTVVFRTPERYERNGATFRVREPS